MVFTRWPYLSYNSVFNLQASISMFHIISRSPTQNKIIKFQKLENENSEAQKDRTKNRRFQQALGES
jgi:hypothetical protein